jgi:repressor LexA
MQNDYQNKIENFFKENKRMPTYSEMMKMFALKSKNSIAKIVDKLIDIGFISKDSSGKLIPSNTFGEIPMLGLVKAGFPALGEEVLNDSTTLEDLLVDKKDLTYMLEVDGDSMIEAHIKKGDMVLVEKTNTAKIGDIVIAEIDGEFTMKYLRQTDGKYWLEPANKAYKPIYPKYDFKISAVVKAVIRKF